MAQFGAQSVPRAAFCAVAAVRGSTLIPAAMLTSPVHLLHAVNEGHELPRGLMHDPCVLRCVRRLKLHIVSQLCRKLCLLNFIRVHTWRNNISNILMKHGRARYTSASPAPDTNRSCGGGDVVSCSCASVPGSASPEFTTGVSLLFCERKWKINTQVNYF